MPGSSFIRCIDFGRARVTHMTSFRHSPTPTPTPTPGVWWNGPFGTTRVIMARGARYLGRQAAVEAMAAQWRRSSSPASLSSCQGLLTPACHLDKTSGVPHASDEGNR